MRMELNIEALNHRKWLQELMQSKQNNTLFRQVNNSQKYANTTDPLDL